MKNILIPALFVALLVLNDGCGLMPGGCGPAPVSIVSAQQAGWTAESFKANYTIQFPTGYKGTGMTLIPGDAFRKTNADSTIILGYTYCNEVSCTDFGTKLADVTTSSLTTTVFGFTRKFSTFIPVMDSGVTVGRFYYTSDKPAYGKLYWNKDGDDLYYEALDLQFTNETRSDVQLIVGSILKKK